MRNVPTAAAHASQQQIKNKSKENKVNRVNKNVEDLFLKSKLLILTFRDLILPYIT